MKWTCVTCPIKIPERKEKGIGESNIEKDKDQEFPREDERHG